MSRSMLRSSFTTVVLLALAASAQGGTLYVANNGLDSPTCGAKKTPCRSITQAANTNAADGDSIIVGPGTYGDLDEDGTLGSVPGEEGGLFGCVLLIAHAVTITSSGGAGVTVIDGRSVSASCNVGIVIGGTTFGKPGKGFTVSNPGMVTGDGIVIDASNVVVEGNEAVGTGSGSQGNGIRALAGAGSPVIEANQAIGWAQGIDVESTGATVHGNRVTLNINGVFTLGSNTVTGNVATANFRGLQSDEGDTIVGNAANGNVNCIFAPDTFTGSAQKNNLVGNQCGVLHSVTIGMNATNNYWGTATGPGPPPADDACNFLGGTTTVTPFAAKPFKVKAPFKP